MRRRHHSQLSCGRGSLLIRQGECGFTPKAEQQKAEQQDDKDENGTEDGILIFFQDSPHNSQPGFPQPPRKRFVSSHFTIIPFFAKMSKQ
jgi:hypothetical protein